MISWLELAFDSYGNKSFLTYSVQERASLDEVEMEMMSRNDIPGILPFNLLQSDDNLKCCYDITSMTKLDFIIGGQVDRQKLFQILEQFAQCMEEAEDYMLDIEHFILNPEYIFVNPGDMRMRMVLVPLRDVQKLQAVTLRDFLRGLMNGIRYDFAGNGGEFYINVSNYLNGTREVRPKEFRTMLYRCMGIAADAVGQGDILSAPFPAVSPLPEQVAESNPVAFEQGRSMDSLSWKNGNQISGEEDVQKSSPGRVQGGRAAGKKGSDKQAAGRETGKKGFFGRGKRENQRVDTIEQPGFGMDVPGQAGFGMDIPGQPGFGVNIPGQEDVGMNHQEWDVFGTDMPDNFIPDAENIEAGGKRKRSLFAKREKVPPLQEMGGVSGRQGGMIDMGGPIPHSVPMGQQDIAVFEEMPVQGFPPDVVQNAVLDGKAQQQNTPSGSQPKSQPMPQPLAEAIAGTILMDGGGEEHPFLENVKTGERIYLDYRGKSELRIGRNPEFVDYVIDNPTVGRVHLTVIHGNDGYFVIDVNSKNGTFIDRRRIQSNVEEPLPDGSQLRLGTEEFYFYTH